jgi:4-hydroxy-tetrahydrodipicolinate synthase
MQTFKVPEGALTAIITPFLPNGQVDWEGLYKLIAFQTSQGITGIVPAGTTGESATLTQREHEHVIAFSLSGKQVFVLAGCGSNCTREAANYVRQTARHGGSAVLLVDPYYNGPSSLEIRKEYYEPIARMFPNIAIVPYVIPGRTGCALGEVDLAILNRDFPNICATKDATGDLARMRNVRRFTSPDFQIFSGDDDLTYQMMALWDIQASGVISVTANIAPFAVSEMCRFLKNMDLCQAEKMKEKLGPLFKVVTVFAVRVEDVYKGLEAVVVKDKFRNPLPIKTMMAGLGMPSGPCRQPLGKMSPNGVAIVRQALMTVWGRNPEVLLPIQDFFGINIDEQLADEKLWKSLASDS